jgi:hypothetical protein
MSLSVRFAIFDLDGILLIIPGETQLIFTREERERTSSMSRVRKALGRSPTSPQLYPRTTEEQSV